MIDCVIIEDEPLARKLLETYVSKMPVLRLVKSFSDSLEALTYLQDHRVDLLFLDIQMPDEFLIVRDTLFRNNLDMVKIW